MRTVVSSRLSVVSGMRGIFICLLLTAYCQLACSIPNLEKPQCTAARDTVKQFYSWYIGTEANVKADHPEIYNKYVSPLFSNSFEPKDWETDHFLLTNDWPKTFRAGSCSVESEDKAVFQVVLLWRDDNSSYQKEVKVEAIKTGNTWLISKVFN